MGGETRPTAAPDSRTSWTTRAEEVEPLRGCRRRRRSMRSATGWRRDPRPVDRDVGDASAATPDNGHTATSRRVPPLPADTATFAGWRTAAIVGLIVAGLLSAAVVLLWGQADDASSDAKDARAHSSPARPTHRHVWTCSRARSPTSRSSSPT